MTPTKQMQSVHIATAGVAIIATVAFLISYSALQRTASMFGFPGWQSWLWPLLIDMPILVFAFTSLVIGWMTNRRSWFATSMIVLFSGATIMFNLAHAEMHWLHYAVAIMPPLALIVSFEALRELIQIVASQQFPESPPPVALVALPEPEAETVTAPVADEPKSSWPEMRAEERAHALQETAHLSTGEAAKILGCHKSTVGRARAKLGQVATGKNGGSA
ncbi:DUF2637 domain-containing protein [Anaerolineales bacterium HSG24]|nr:DUF2637 domain-containing protein [Anaerolineales bacterium HSG24]